MHWRRHLRLTGYVLLGVVCLPVAACLLCLLVLALLVLVVFVFCCVASAVVGSFLWQGLIASWNNLPRNRRAVARARQALDAALPGRDARRWLVARRDRHKCFVRAELTRLTNPRTVWLCAVWDSGRVDHLGAWQFRGGVGVRHAARAYDRSRAAGRPWPTEMGQLAEQAPPGELPSAARPGLSPHFGSVIVRRDGGFAFYAIASFFTAELSPDDLPAVEVYDAECRPLRLGAGSWPRRHAQVLAPFPPAPPDKVFVVRLRHYLMGRADEATKQRLRQALPAELAEYGIRTHDETATLEEFE
jgi:hypothetical protein